MEIDDVVQTIYKSGHKVTFDVARILKGYAWDTVISPRYIDDTFGKVREMDIIAKRRSSFKFKERDIRFTIKLIVETKYLIKSPIFYTQENELEDYEKPINRFALSFPKQQEDLVSKLVQSIPSEDHRYFPNTSPHVAVFSDRINAGRDDIDEIFTTTSSTIKTITFEIDKLVTNKFADQVTLYYPIVVTKGQQYYSILSTVNLDDEKEIKKNVTPITRTLCKINYLQKIEFDKPADLWDYQPYYVDVIDIAELEIFLKKLNEELQFIHLRLER
ncbi:MAG: hypothetical protein PHY34_02865 [Patescibacteria group bacterium]|nr:hypothetical protein [Patescibacteria group bacterium]MDD5715400.1 hypothetical protein [Patescibacteria group bacterium]